MSANGCKRSNGFTLMELLIVIAIILILMLMAIPTIGSLKKQANETSAINSDAGHHQGCRCSTIRTYPVQRLRLLADCSGRRSQDRPAHPGLVADCCRAI